MTALMRERESAITQAGLVRARLVNESRRVAMVEWRVSDWGAPLDPAVSPAMARAASPDYAQDPVLRVRRDTLVASL
jgi:hypothetical protein